MSPSRVDTLFTRLEKGHRKTLETLSQLTPEEWQQTIYHEQDWTVQDLLAHFVATENYLRDVAQNVAVGGPSAPRDFDLDTVNEEARERLADRSPQRLLADLDQARRHTLQWVRTLDEAQLDNTGRHPGLGEVNLETMILSLYGHQLLHMRDLQARMK